MAPKAVLGTEASFPAVTSRHPQGTSLESMLALGLVSSGHRLMLTQFGQRNRSGAWKECKGSHHRPDMQKQALSTESGAAPGRDELPAGTPYPPSGLSETAASPRGPGAALKSIVDVPDDAQGAPSSIRELGQQIHHKGMPIPVITSTFPREPHACCPDQGQVLSE